MTCNLWVKESSKDPDFIFQEEATEVVKRKRTIKTPVPVHTEIPGFTTQQIQVHASTLFPRKRQPVVAVWGGGSRDRLLSQSATAGYERTGPRQFMRKHKECPNDVVQSPGC